ncbi:uncharacterized protein LOC135493803 [Lineus longissimus]|uniref:uncharacterized protein LOC135493803 n=1 Tax=Lineus longissimus TaxID=88925 RepID=UPI00315C58B3
MEINVVSQQKQKREAGDAFQPSLTISTSGETYNLGKEPEETCQLVQQLKQTISKDGYAIAEQADLSVRASLSLRLATFTLIASNKCDATRLNEIFDLAMRFGKCMDDSKLAVIEYDSACKDVLECSTIGFLYAVEGRKKRALAKFTASRKKADEMKDAFRRVKEEISDLSTEVKAMRTRNVDSGDGASKEVEASEKIVRGLTSNIKAKEKHVADLNTTIESLRRKWFPGNEPQTRMEEMANIQQDLLNLQFSKISAQSEVDKASAFDQGICCTVDAFKKIEASLQRQVSFWQAIGTRYNTIVEKLIDHTSDEDDFEELLSSQAFKYEALVTHSWFVAMRQRLKPTIRLMGECVNRFYNVVTDHPNLDDAKAQLEQMIEDEKRDISQLLDEMRRIESAPTLDPQPAVEKPNMTRRRKASKELRDQPPKSPSDPNPGSTTTWGHLILRIALIALVCFAVLLLIGSSNTPVTK